MCMWKVCKLTKSKVKESYSLSENTAFEQPEMIRLKSSIFLCYFFLYIYISLGNTFDNTGLAARSSRSESKNRFPHSLTVFPHGSRFCHISLTCDHKSYSLLVSQLTNQSRMSFTGGLKETERWWFAAAMYSKRKIVFLNIKEHILIDPKNKIILKLVNEYIMGSLSMLSLALLKLKPNYWSISLLHV